MTTEPSPEEPQAADRARFHPSVEAATYTADELAALLNVSVRHVWRLRDLNQLPTSIRLGKLVRWPRKLVNEWLALQHDGGRAHG